MLVSTARCLRPGAAVALGHGNSRVRAAGQRYAVFRCQSARYQSGEGPRPTSSHSALTQEQLAELGFEHVPQVPETHVVRLLPQRTSCG